MTLTWRGAGGLSVEQIEEQHREADGRFKLDRKAQTERLLRAMSNPHTTIIGHMTGRQLQRRPATCNPGRRCAGAANRGDLMQTR